MWRHPQRQFYPRGHAVLEQERLWHPGKAHFSVQGLPACFKKFAYGQPLVRAGDMKDARGALLSHLDDPHGHIAGIDALHLALGGAWRQDLTAGRHPLDPVREAPGGIMRTHE